MPAETVSESDVQIVARARQTPRPGAASVFVGTGDVAVTDGVPQGITPHGTTTLRNGFTFKSPGTITGVVPASGQAGTRVAVSGVDLRCHGDRVASVRLGNVEATVVNDGNEIVHAVAGDGPLGGAADVDVVLRSDTGAAVTSKRAWAYLKPALVSSVVPAAGQQGTVVTVSGE